MFKKVLIISVISFSLNCVCMASDPVYVDLWLNKVDTNFLLNEKEYNIMLKNYLQNDDYKYWLNEINLTYVAEENHLKVYFALLGDYVFLTYADVPSENVENTNKFIWKKISSLPVYEKGAVEYPARNIRLVSFYLGDSGERSSTTNYIYIINANGTLTRITDSLQLQQELDAVKKAAAPPKPADVSTAANKGAAGNAGNTGIAKKPTIKVTKKTKEELGTKKKREQGYRYSTYY